MTDRIKIEVLDRREFVIGAGAGAAAVVTAFLAGSDEAIAKKPTLQELITRLGGGATPSAGKITLKLPDLAQDGSSVPLTVSVDSPMTPENYVKSLHVLAPGNPTPHIFTFNFSPKSGMAKTSSRMRLAQTQEVTVLAQMSDGKVILAKHTVKVVAGGCN